MCLIDLIDKLIYFQDENATKWDYIQITLQAPACVLELLRTGAEENLVLRWTTFLANILHTVKESHLSASSLPPDDKAPSPETMYSALYGMNSIGQIKSKVFLLCRHRNEDIKHQASRIYQTLNAKWRVCVKESSNFCCPESLIPRG